MPLTPPGGMVFWNAAPTLTPLPILLLPFLAQYGFFGSSFEDANPFFHVKAYSPALPQSVVDSISDTLFMLKEIGSPVSFALVSNHQKSSQRAAEHCFVTFNGTVTRTQDSFVASWSWRDDYPEEVGLILIFGCEKGEKKGEAGERDSAIISFWGVCDRGFVSDAIAVCVCVCAVVGLFRRAHVCFVARMCACVPAGVHGERALSQLPALILMALPLIPSSPPPLASDDFG